jgi:hypothetical protein
LDLAAHFTYTFSFLLHLHHQQTVEIREQTPTRTHSLTHSLTHYLLLAVNETEEKKDGETGAGKESGAV